MDDSDLIQNFIRQKAVGDSVHLLVCVINWDGPATPITRWKVAARINVTDSEEKLDAEIELILRDKRYFGICKECGERNPTGWMHSNELCQSCAEKFGVVY